MIIKTLVKSSINDVGWNSIEYDCMYWYVGLPEMIHIIERAKFRDISFFNDAIDNELLIKKQLLLKISIYFKQIILEQGIEEIVYISDLIPLIELINNIVSIRYSRITDKEYYTGNHSLLYYINKCFVISNESKPIEPSSIIEDIWQFVNTKLFEIKNEYNPNYNPYINTEGILLEIRKMIQNKMG